MTDAALTREQLAAFFVLMETSSLLHFEVEKHLREDGGLSWVQFQILAGLNDLPSGQQRLTDIADRVVLSRSGLTYQAGALEKAGYVRRRADASDERASMLAITRKGRALVTRLLPGHIAVTRGMLIDHLTPETAAQLTAVLTHVRDEIRTRPPRSSYRKRPAGRS